MGYLSRHAKTLRLLADLLSVIVSFYVAYSLIGRMGHLQMQPFDAKYFMTEVLCLTSWSFSLVLFAEYPNRASAWISQNVKIVVLTNIFAMLVFALCTFLFKIVIVSRLFVCLYFTCVILLMFMNRYAVRAVLYLLRKSGWDTNTRVVVGATSSAWQYVLEATRNKASGVRILGYIAEQPQLGNLVHLGNYDEIDEILKRLSPDGVVVALKMTHPEVERIIRACEKQGISVELLLDNFSFRATSSTVYHGTTISTLFLSAIPHTHPSLLIKRATDVVFSLAGLIVFSPLFVVVAIAIKLEDRGPVFFKQERAGLRNKIFWIYKFRSMRVDAEEVKKSLLHLNEMSGPVFKLTNDPRVTKVGKVIRSLSIDELPQLFNVLKGDMSLVGPRPPLPLEVLDYIDEHRRRLSVKPGLTCLWQVSGRNDIDFDQWMNLDLAYIDNWTYFQDWKIIFRTIPAVLKRTGAK